MAGQGLLAAYLIVGTDQLKRDRAISRLKAHLDEGLAAFNLDERNAATAQDPTDVAISLNTLPVGPGFRLVLIHDANKLPKAVSQSIVAYLDNPNPGCVLCLVADSLARNTRLYKAVERMGKHAVIDCTPLKPRDLPTHIARIAKGRGVTIDLQAAQELVSRTGDDMALLDRQLTTLADVSSMPDRITIQDVEQHIPRTAEVKPWDFLDKVAAGDAARALELYRHMQDPSQLALLSLLVRRVRELICAKALSERGTNARGVAQALGRQDWQVRGYIQSARRFSMSQLEACLARCAACERSLKGGADPDATFVELVLFICKPA